MTASWVLSRWVAPHRFGLMTGRERTRLLAVRSEDPVLSVLGAVGLAVSAGTALLVDLGDRLGGPSARTLADLAVDGPRLEETAPSRRGVAVIQGGGIGVDEAHLLAGRLAQTWPVVVVRAVGPAWPGALVPVVALYPGWLSPKESGPAVWQRLSGGPTAPGPGPVLPLLRAGVVRRVLAGKSPLPGRWLRVWRGVWGLRWD